MKLSGWLRWGAAIILLLIITGVILSNYSTGIYFAIGLLITMIAIGLRILIPHLGGRTPLILLTMIILIVLPIAGVFVILVNERPAHVSCILGEKKTVLELTEYSANVEAANFAEGSFRVNEHVTYSKWESTCTDYDVWRGWGESALVEENVEKDLPGKTIQAEKRGLFMYEVIIPVAGGGYGCCPDQGRVVIKNIPYNSFYDAQYADDLKIDEYLGKETVAWQSSYVADDIRFAYLPAPFYDIRVVLNPFIQLSKFDNKILALLGFAISSMFLLVVKPNLIDFIKDKLKNVFRKGGDSQTKPPITRKKINPN